MTRTTGSSGAKTLEAIKRAGVKRIYEHGFEAMKLRDLAADVGIQPGSLYNYITQKEEFLFTLIREIMEELHAGLRATLEGAHGPLDALERFVDFHIRWHTARRREVFIGNMELRSLSQPHYREIVELRQLYEGELRSILEDGNRRGVWSVDEPQITTFAIIAMLTGVCTWYRPRGRLSQDQLVAHYRSLVLSTVALRPA
ncbi:TetR family transcriptional regulator [Enterovirga sp. CN4-39]|uniref:TetR family transcriptional regulator n=1 Tax=Enterovirga sp. CN4-39 TaxID=3400910 RepID=UPI003BFC17F9